MKMSDRCDWNWIKFDVPLLCWVSTYLRKSVGPFLSRSLGDKCGRKAADGITVKRRAEEETQQCAVGGNLLMMIWCYRIYVM